MIIGTSYNLYYLETRSGSGEHLYTPIEGADNSAFENTSFYLANSGKPVVNSSTSDITGYLSRSMTRSDNYQMNFTAAYNRDFGLHSVGGLFSIEKSESETEYLYGMVTNPYEFTTGQSNSVDWNSTPSTEFTRFESGNLSYIGRLNYSYDNKYLLEFLLRSDSSTKFAPENYWGFFPSVSAGWVVSQEEWFTKNVTWIDYLKLRASFGLTGRDNTTAWQWLQTYGTDKDKGPVFGT